MINSRSMNSSKYTKDNLQEFQLTPPSLSDIRAAAKNIATKAVRTPLVRLNPRVKYKAHTNHEVG